MLCILVYKDLVHTLLNIKGTQYDAEYYENAQYFYYQCETPHSKVGEGAKDNSVYRNDC